MSVLPKLSHTVNVMAMKTPSFLMGIHKLILKFIRKSLKQPKLSWRTKMEAHSARLKAYFEVTVSKRVWHWCNGREESHAAEQNRPPMRSQASNEVQLRAVAGNLTQTALLAGTSMEQCMSGPRLETTSRSNSRWTSILNLNTKQENLKSNTKQSITRTF